MQSLQLENERLKKVIEQLRDENNAMAERLRAEKVDRTIDSPNDQSYIRMQQAMIAKT
jgi:hypothetical protein